MGSNSEGLRHENWQAVVDRRTPDVNCLELLAASLAIQTFVKERSQINILVRTDNVSTRAYINHLGGGTHSKLMNSLATHI